MGALLKAMGLCMRPGCCFSGVVRVADDLSVDVAVAHIHHGSYGSTVLLMAHSRQ